MLLSLWTNGNELYLSTVHKQCALFASNKSTDNDSMGIVASGNGCMGSYA